MAEEPDLAERAESAEDLPDPRAVVARDEEVPLAELFDDAFVREHTDFETFDGMVAASPADATSAADLGLIRAGEWDEFVAETTAFADEEELVFAAIDSWVADELGL
jgi:hypothetical protein